MVWISEVGGTSTDFWELTSGQIIDAIKYHRALSTQSQQREYEHIRLLAFWMLQPYSNQLTRPDKLVRFPWEVSLGPVLSKQDRQAIIERIKRRDQKIAEQHGKDTR